MVNVKIIDKGHGKAELSVNDIQLPAKSYSINKAIDDADTLTVNFIIDKIDYNTEQKD